MSTGIRGTGRNGGSTKMRSRWATTGCLALTIAIGCNGADSNDVNRHPAYTLPALRALGADGGDVVVARGKLEPASGVIGVVVAPGDRLLRLDVAEGDWVEKDATLGELDGLEARKIEKDFAEKQLAEAKAAAKAKKRVAVANLEVARVGLKQAELLVAQGEEELQQATQPDGRMGLLKKEVELAEAKLKQLKEAAAENLVSQSTLDHNQLEVDQSKSELNAARVSAEQKIESGKLAVEAAKKEIEAAEVAIEAGEKGSLFASLEGQLVLLDLQVKASELVSPLAGRVVSIDLNPGEATVGLPVMQIADTRQMVCRAEINVADLPRIKVGTPAKISSLALPRVLSGKIKSVSQIIGSPKLPSANPLAQVDWRSVEVMISIDEQDNQVAASLINLQVDVAIKAQPRSDYTAPGSKPADADKTESPKADKQEAEEAGDGEAEEAAAEDAAKPDDS